VTASPKNPESGGINFRVVSECIVIERLLYGPDGINPVKKVLAQGEKTLVQCWHCVSRLDDLVKLRDLRGGSVTKTDPMTIFRGE